MLTHPGRRGPGCGFYAALWLLMIGLRQDFWNWRDPTLIFGFLPIGLAYQVLYSIVAVLVLVALVRWAWPGHLESLEPPARE